MAEFPAFPVWTDAYLGDTTHLTTLEHGAFLLLLFSMWRAKTHDLPDDDKILARYTRLTPSQWKRIRPVIEDLCVVKNGKWSNGRLLDELDAVRQKVKQRSDAGRASALKRKNRGSTTAQRNANETPTPIATPITTKKEREVEARSQANGHAPAEDDFAIPESMKREPEPKGTDPPAKQKMKRAHRLPDDWHPDMDTVDWAETEMPGINVERETQKFCDHFKANGKPMIDWNAAHRNWLRRSGDFNRAN